MHYVGRASVVVLSVLASSLVSAQGIGQSLTVTNYQLVSQVKGQGAQVNLVYRVDAVNSGPVTGPVTATVASLDPFSIRIFPGQDTVHFPPVPASGHVTSIDTFSIVLTGNPPPDFTKLQWTLEPFVQAPVANAGQNQTAKLGATVILNASASTNPSGVGTLNYSWDFVSKPAGSAAKLTNPTALKPTFVVDVLGDYVIAVTVSNGLSSATANVTVTTHNTAPVANAGPNQTVAAGATVHLDGSASSDVDGDPITYLWTLTSPAGSTATLTGATTASPSFVADKGGSYVAGLVVNDGNSDSVPSTVTINIPPQNSPPVANAGPNQIAKLGGLIQLTGAASTDANGLPLTYLWSLITRPQLSTATLTSTTTVNPLFSIDLDGDYVVQLIVNNGKVSSAPTTVTITTNPPQSPIAHAGNNQTIKRQGTVLLAGSGTDPQGLPISFNWSLIDKPVGSTAKLSSSTGATPTFVADLGGTYIAQLIVNNTFLNSTPSTVTFTTSNTAPVANAGANRNVTVGATVTLDGHPSTDADQDPLTYAWTLLSKPAGSTAVLTAATTASPMFVADVAGAYVAQLIVNDGIANSSPITVMITAAVATNLTLSPNPLNFGSNTTGLLTVTLPAPASDPAGQVINLVSANTSVVTVPPSITVPQNALGANIIVTPLGIGSTSITASAAGLTSASATVNVIVPAITLTLDNPTVGLTRTMNATITLSAPAPAGGVAINLSAAPGGVVSFPATVTLEGGNTTAVFAITGSTVGFATMTAGAAGYQSSSANLNVGKLGAIVIDTGVTLGPNRSAPITIRLVTPAPAGGVTISLSSSDPSTVSITPSVFIPFRASVPATQPQVTGVNFGTAEISASAPGFDGDTEQVSVAGSMVLSPATVTFTAGTNHNLTLTLSAPAPAGLSIVLSSSDASVATVPATVTFAANATTVDVPVAGVSAGSAVIKASAASHLAETTSTVVIVPQQPINLRPNVILGLGESVPFPVTLPTTAPFPVTVTLTSSDPAKVSVTGSVVIPAGATAPATQSQVTGLNLGSADITATATGYSTITRNVLVQASISLPATLTVNTGATANLKLTLSGPAPVGGLTVNISSSSTGIGTVPATVSFAAGATTVDVPVTGVAVGSTSITASASNLSPTVSTVTVTVPSSIVLASNVSVGLGQSITFPVTLSTPAPAALTVTLASSDTSKVTIPATVVIPQGATVPATQPQVTGVGLGSADITASATGYVGATKSVQVSASIAFAGNLTVGPGNSGNLTLNLSGLAPANFPAIVLASNDTAVATVPATVTFAPGATSVTVPVQGVAQGSAIITASAPSLANATANVSVGAQPPIALSLNVSVGIGQTATFAVNLSSPAPSALTVTLSSSDTSKVTIPASILIPQGATAPLVQPLVTGAGIGSANITATAPGYTAATQAVQVTGMLNFTGGLTVSATLTANLTLTLSGPAPSGGLTVNLVSNNTSAATVPGTVTFAAGSTSTSVLVTGVAPGNAIVSATGNNLVSAAVSVNVVPLPSIVMPASLGVGLAQAVTLEITLQTRAQSAVTVTLVSSDPAKATVTASVVIPQGATTPVTQPQVTGVAAGTTIITATATGYASANTVASVAAPSITVALESSNVGLTHTINGSFTLGVPAPPSGAVVTLVSSPAGVVSVQPATVSVAPGSSTGTFTVLGVSVGSSSIVASAPGYTNGSVGVSSQGLGAITLPPGIVIGANQPTTFPVSLVTPAPVGGVTITLTSSDPSLVTISPGSVFIPFRATTPATQPQVTGVGFGAASITASAPGFTGDTQQVQITGSIFFQSSNLIVTGGTTQNLSLVLSSPAPAGGVTINLSSSNPSAVTVPATVTIPASATAVNVPVTGLNGGSAVIHASALPNLADTSANITVFMFGSLSVAAGVQVPVGQTAPIPVTLSAPAFGAGVTVTLTSSDTTKATVTSSVFIPRGATSALAVPQVTGIAVGSATITASAPGFGTMAQTVQVTP